MYFVFSCKTKLSIWLYEKASVKIKLFFVNNDVSHNSKHKKPLPVSQEKPAAVFHSFCTVLWKHRFIRKSRYIRWYYPRKRYRCRWEWWPVRPLCRQCPHRTPDRSCRQPWSPAGCPHCSCVHGRCILPDRGCVPAYRERGVRLHLSLIHIWRCRRRLRCRSRWSPYH